MRSLGKTDIPNRRQFGITGRTASEYSLGERFSMSDVLSKASDDEAMFFGISAERAERIWRRLFYSLFVAALTYGLITGGHIGNGVGILADKIDSLFRDAGFAISNVTIVGQKRAQDKDILSVLGVEKVSLLRFNTQKARERIEGLEWVASARVMRFFPATVKIIVEERKPYALWQTQGQHFLIDTKGVVIKEQKLSELQDFGQLPLIVGEGADDAARLLFDSLRRHPKIALKLKAARRIAKRRWTLNMRNGSEVLLPERNFNEALSQLASLDRQYGLLTSEIKNIDLRLSDRITLRRFNNKRVPGGTTKQKSYSQVHIRRSGA